MEIVKCGRRTDTSSRLLDWLFWILVWGVFLIHISNIQVAIKTVAGKYLDIWNSCSPVFFPI